jgi:hypothetical protein
MSYSSGNYLKNKIKAFLAGQPRTGLVVLLLRRSEFNHSIAQSRDDNVPSEFGTNPAEVVGFFRYMKKSSACLPSEGK